jgi:hypothetical protein
VNPIALRICHHIKDQFHKHQKVENLTTPFNKEWYYLCPEKNAILGAFLVKVPKVWPNV